jgi:hypothetical protein
LEGAVVVSTTYRVRLTDDWLPLPTALLAALGWREGDAIELEVVEGVVIATRAPEDGQGAQEGYQRD